MSISQKKIRELVFQLLYAKDLGDPDPSAMIALLMKEHLLTRKTVLQAQQRAEAIFEKKEALDKEIETISTSYDLDRIHSVERNILRLGLFELEYDKEIPPKVAISEAIRLASKFSTPEGATFVNALLDSLWKKLEPPKEPS